MAKVLILLSTYNGEKYLQQQLDSLYNQTVDVDILIRDDGSSDNTSKILLENKDHLDFFLGDNIGYAKSFLELVKKAPDDFDYYMFCDQDDFWLNNKVEKAIELFENTDKTIPTLYYSAVNLADEELNIYQKNVSCLIKKSKELVLQEVLMKSYGFGCTMMFNLSLKKKFAKLPMEDMNCHDWYMQKVALLFGKIVYDDNSYILYRQHSANLVGFNKTKGIKTKINHEKKTRYTRSNSAKVLIKTYYDELNEEKQCVLRVVANSKRLINRLKIFFSFKYVAYPFKTSVLLKIYTLLGRL